MAKKVKVTVSLDKDAHTKLAEIVKKYELASLSAAVRLLLSKCDGEV